MSVVARNRPKIHTACSVDSDWNRDQHPNYYANANSVEHPIGNSDRIADADLDANPNYYANSDSYRNPNKHADRDTDIHGHKNSDNNPN